EAEIAQALTGTYREEHLFELKLAYEAWQFALGQIEKVDGQIALQLGRMKCDRALPPLKPKARPKRRVNSPRFDVRAALDFVGGHRAAIPRRVVEQLAPYADSRDHLNWLLPDSLRLCAARVFGRVAPCSPRKRDRTMASHSSSKLWIPLHV